jgi:hypothetical protein
MPVSMNTLLGDLLAETADVETTLAPLDAAAIAAPTPAAGWIVRDQVTHLAYFDEAVLWFELPNLRALNFVVAGILGDGVASATRPNPQAKGLGEYLRSRLVDIPETIIPA